MSLANSAYSAALTFFGHWQSDWREAIQRLGEIITSIHRKESAQNQHAQRKWRWALCYMKSSFPKLIKCHSKKKMEFKCQSQICRLSFRKELFLCEFIWVYLDIHEEPVTKTRFMNLALIYETHFLEWRLMRFGKELSI